MTQNYAMIDGKRINLSKETMDSLKRTLGVVEHKQVKVYCFRATKVKTMDAGYPYNLGSARLHTTEWDGKCADDSKAQITCYTKEEVKQIIAGLQELLES